MTSGIVKLCSVALLPLLATACTTSSAIDGISDPMVGFATVAARTDRVARKEAVWIQNRDDARAASKRVRRLVLKKTIGPDTAVQVALLSNRGLQAAYADIGISAADVWQESLLVNPRVAVELTGFDPFRTLEASIINNILAVATRPQRVAIANTRFRQAQLRAAEETLRVAAETRRAWIKAVSAWETVTYLNQAQTAADAASELAQKLGETGAFTKSGQAREHVFYAELAGRTAEARLAARAAKEELTRSMGLWGVDVDYQVPNALPTPSKSVKTKRAIEAEALRQRVDLEIARLELEALAQSYGLKVATRYVTDVELLTGVAIERSGEDGKTSASPRVGADFAIPIFDSGEARLRKAELGYMRAANLLAERAVNIRSEAREAYDGYRSTYDISRHYRNNVLPLRVKIEEESILNLNGMITNTFELLADTRAKLSSIMLSINAKRNFWLADVNLGVAIHGGGDAATSDGEAMSVVDGETGGGH